MRKPLARRSHNCRPLAASSLELPKVQNSGPGVLEEGLELIAGLSTGDLP